MPLPGIDHLHRIFASQPHCSTSTGRVACEEPNLQAIAHAFSCPPLHRLSIDEEIQQGTFSATLDGRMEYNLLQDSTVLRIKAASSEDVSDAWSSDVENDAGKGDKQKERDFKQSRAKAGSGSSQKEMRKARKANMDVLVLELGSEGFQSGCFIFLGVRRDKPCTSLCTSINWLGVLTNVFQQTIQLPAVAKTDRSGPMVDRWRSRGFEYSDQDARRIQQV